MGAAWGEAAVRLGDGWKMTAGQEHEVGAMVV